MLLRQSELTHTQLQLSTQKRVLLPSDDPVAATSISSLQTEIAQLEQFNLNGSAADANISLEESVLSTVTDILFRVRDLMVSLGNGAYSFNEIAGIGSELEERLDEVLGLANTKNSNGDYIFSGSKVKTAPYARETDGSFSYNGDQNQRMLRISSGFVIPISDPGFDVFSDIKNGNGDYITSANNANTGTGIIDPGSYQAPPNFLAESYTIDFGVDGGGNTTYTVTGDPSAAVIVPATVWKEDDAISFNGITTKVSGEPLVGDQFRIDASSSQDIFSNIQLAIDATTGYQDTEAGKALYYNQLNSVQETMDKQMQNIDLVRGKVGSRLNIISSEENSNLSLLITNKTALSDIQDLDVVEASTRFSQQLVVLEAAQASFVRVQGLSLFNFL